ncbi:hypothetical protein [Burkholderia sp. 567]|uniref:hypothetical protein n=1 Tax=Burkholderia sp. 567 TaxID=3156413 RepID=UPI0033967D31
MRSAPRQRRHIEQVDHQRAPHRAASPGDAAIVISRSISLRGFTRRERLAEQMHRQQRRAEMPFDRSARGARGSQLAGNSTGTIAAFLTRDLREAQRCKAARRAHAAILPSA